MSGLLAVPFCQLTKRKKTVERTNSGGTGGGKHIRQFSSPIFPSVHSRTLNYVELVLADYLLMQRKSNINSVNTSTLYS